jgi:UDPglucose 6-dehydrogenase
MRVCVIGTGYVGLVTGVCLAHIGHQVICVDNNEAKVELMRSGKSPIYEPGLDEIMASSMTIGNLEFTTDINTAIADSQILFIAVPVVITDLNSAETIKYAANSFLATKISFINEVANICDRVGADITQVAEGIGLDSRIGNKFLQAGIGWGGSCFPKDVSALIHTATDYGYDAELLKASVKVNSKQRLLAIEKLQQILKILKGKTIGLLGLTFKPDTDDLRDAPAIELIEELNRLGAKVKAYDPLIKSSQHHSVLRTIELENTPKNLVTGCDALVLVTDWQEFQSWNYIELAKLMNNPIIIDGRNYLDADTINAAGFSYLGIGRPTVENNLVAKKIRVRSTVLTSQVA